MPFAAGMFIIYKHLAIVIYCKSLLNHRLTIGFNCQHLTLGIINALNEICDSESSDLIFYLNGMERMHYLMIIQSTGNDWTMSWLTFKSVAPKGSIRDGQNAKEQ